MSLRPRSRRWAFLFAAPVLLILIAVAGPRPEVDDGFDPFPESVDPAAWVAERASEFPDIVPGTEHRLIWADSLKARTEWAVVYVHGFSGSSAMAHPFVDSLAARLGANAYLPRMTGHGRTAEVFAEARLSDWVQDMADAVAIGDRLGERVLLVGLSNGAALSLWAASHPALGARIDALAVLSPNVRPADPTSEILLWPWGGTLAEAVVGDTRTWEPFSEAHARFTTNSYPTRALLPMMATVKLLRNQDPGRITAPVIMIYSGGDTVISVTEALSFFDRIPTRKAAVDVGDVGDPNDHVIVGDALSPDNTMPAVEHILSFINASE